MFNCMHGTHKLFAMRNRFCENGMQYTDTFLLIDISMGKYLAILINWNLSPYA